MRVLHVITRMIAGGAQRNTLRTAALHRRAGIDSEILHGPSDDPRDGELLAEARAAQVPLHYVDSLVRAPSPRKDLRTLVRLMGFLRRNRYDIVHTHTSKAGFLGRLAARLAAVPAVVHTPHGHVFHSYYGPLTTRVYMLLERCAINWADRTVALTPRERAEHLDLGIGRPAQFVVVPSGIDIERFRAKRGTGPAARARLGFEGTAFVIGCVARLAAVKGQATLIRALPAVLERLPGATVALVGDGADRESLAELARTLGVGPQVRFLGRFDHPEEVFPAFDIAVVPSLNEGMGRVVLEAMATGVPVVASAVGGICDLVADGETGRLVPAADPHRLAAALTELALDPATARRLAATAARTVAPSFGEEAMAERLLTLYDEVLRGAQSPRGEQRWVTEAVPCRPPDTAL